MQIASLIQSSESLPTSSKLLGQIKDEQFYSTLSTITLQLARESGASMEVIDSLAECLRKAKNIPEQILLPSRKQILNHDSKQNTQVASQYDSFEKSIGQEQQVIFLRKMQRQLLESREKQRHTSALKIYATKKHAELLPLQNVEIPTKKDRFKKLLSRKNQSTLRTTDKYFKMGPLDVLKNVFERENQCYQLMRSFTMLKTVFGHSIDFERESSCPLYNVMFDQSEKLIISGGQEGSIKIWSKETGLLFATLKESLSKDDFNIYRYELKYSKEAHILISQILDDNSLVLLGFDSGDILMFDFRDLFKVDPIKGQTQPLSNVFNLPVRHHLRKHCDQIRELKWHSSGQYFVTGGKQGYCLLWKLQDEGPTVLKEIQVSKTFNRRKKRAFGCNFISFNCTQTHFVAGFMELIEEDDQQKGNGDIIVYSLEDQQVTCEFSKDMPMKVAAVRGMDTHPIYPNIVVICESTGRILLFDFLLKTILNVFELRGFHMMHPQFSLNPGDCRFSKDGKYFVVSTEYGSISLFGYDIKPFYDMCPAQQFFETDFVTFTNDQSLRPIPIQGDLLIDINRIDRGEIRNHRGQIYDKQLKSTFQKYWANSSNITNKSARNHRNSICSLLGSDQEQNREYFQFLEKVKHNIKQAQSFQSFYHSILQEIETTKQAILYDERDKQSKIFQKLIQEKIRKINGNISPVYMKASISNSNEFEKSHDDILEELDLRGRRGGRGRESGRRLIKQSQRANNPYGNYREDFNYQEGDEYEINQDNEAVDLQELDQNLSGESDSLPRMPRRRNPRLSTQNRTQYGRARYNIRQRVNGYRLRYNEDVSENSESQEIIRRPNYKRRNPAEDIEDMLNNEDYKNYDQSNRRGRKKRKLNRMYEGSSDQDDMFINDGDEVNRNGNRRTRQNYTMSSRRQAYYNRGKRKTAVQAQNRIDEPNYEDQIYVADPNQLGRQHEQMNQESSNSRYGLRKRNLLRISDQNSILKETDSSNRRVTRQNDPLGQCLRCMSQESVVQCQICEQAVFCDPCKLKRGRQISPSKYQCFICIYLNDVGTAIVSEASLTEQYFRLEGSEKVEQKLDIYIPQIDDQVRFFFQGYQEFLGSNINCLNRNIGYDIQDYRLMPHIYEDLYSDQLLQTPKCKVVDIRFYFPFRSSESEEPGLNRSRRKEIRNEKKHVQMLINLQILPETKQKQKELVRKDFWVFYIPSPSISSQFLLRQAIFSFIKEKKVVENIRIDQTVSARIDALNYQLVGYGPFESFFPESLWKYVTVAKSDSKRLRNANRDEQKHMNIWQFQSYVPVIKYFHSYDTHTMPAKIISAIQKILQDQDNHLFKDFVDLEIYDNYRNFVQVGVCLELMLKRTANGYYRSLRSLQFDLNLMVKNCTEFNGPVSQSQFTQRAANIRIQILSKVFEGIQNLQPIGQESFQPEILKKEVSSSTKKKKKNGSSFKDMKEDNSIQNLTYSMRGNSRSNSSNRQMKGQILHINEKTSQKTKLPMVSSRGRLIKRKQIDSEQEQFNEPIKEVSSEFEFKEDLNAAEIQYEDYPEQGQYFDQKSNSNARPIRNTRLKKVGALNNFDQSFRVNSSRQSNNAFKEDVEASKNLRSSRRKERYIDSSVDSHTEKGAPAENSGHPYGTRKSTRKVNKNIQ